MTQQKSPQSIGRALASALPGGVAARLPGPGLLAAWRDLVGPMLAQRSLPVRLDVDGALVVAVRGEVFRQELALAAPQLVAALGRAGLGVSSLKLIKGRAAPPAPPPEPAPRPLSAAEQADLERMVAGVADPKVRQALLAAMTAQFSSDPDRHK